VGSLLISGYVTYLTTKYNKPSIVMIVLWILIIISLVVLPTFAIMNGVDDPDTLLKAGKVCK